LRIRRIWHSLEGSGWDRWKVRWWWLRIVLGLGLSLLLWERIVVIRLR
jgi:hypothetical protein